MIGRAAAIAPLALALSVALFAGCQNIVGSTPLKVGDCFNYTDTTDANGDPINVPSVLDCAQAHSDEVFSIFDYPSASAFPGYEAIGTLQQTRCQADFKTYVGVDWEQSTYTIGYDGPTEDTWATGDHAVRCLIEDASGGQLTGSARGTAK